MSADHLHGDDDDVPEWLCCPISMEPMKDPVTAADGMTYERSSITQWFQNKKTSPSTGAELSSTSLIPNRALKCLIDEWHTSHGSCWTNTPVAPSLPASEGPSPVQKEIPSGIEPSGSSAPPAEAVESDSQSGIVPSAVHAAAQPEAQRTPPVTAAPNAQPRSPQHSLRPPAAAASAGGSEEQQPAAVAAPSAAHEPTPGDTTPAGATIEARQQVTDSGIYLRCEEVRPGGEELRAYVQWAVRNEHPAHRAVSVTLSWKAENQFAAYNYALPDAPITVVLQPGEEQQVYSSDKILQDLPFGGTGAEWEYTWKLV